jgi:hypothetical protein
LGGVVVTASGGEPSGLPQCLRVNSEIGESADVTSGRSRRAVFGRSMLIVLAWHSIPALDIGVGAAALSRQPSSCVDTCGWIGLALAGQVLLTLLSLMLATIITALLSSLGRRWPPLRRIAVAGNLGAMPGILLTAIAIPWLGIWLQS